MRRTAAALLLSLFACQAPEVPVGDPKPRTAGMPAPVAGGTLWTSADGTFALVSDPDGHRLFRVDLVAAAVTQERQLAEGARPGQWAVDREGQAHVVLRGRGAVATFSAATLDPIAETRVCDLPNGIAVIGDRVEVACSRGEQVTIDLASQSTSARPAPADARDLVQRADGELLVSGFRAAALFTSSSVAAPRAVSHEDRAPMLPAVAWRTVADPQGGVWMLHQLGSTAPVRLDAVDPPYAGGDAVACGKGVVHSALSLFDGDTVSTWDLQVAGVLPVDLAVSASGEWLAIAAAGSRRVSLGSRAWLLGSAPCVSVPERQVELLEQPVAVAFLPDDSVLVQTREPLRLVRLPRHGALERIDLDAAAPHHPGHRRFHLASRAGVSCASCHPEATDDGRVWQFDGVGGRRTQPLHLGVASSAPYHWDGELPSLGEVIERTFVERMGDAPATREEEASMIAWLDQLRPAPIASDALFRAQGCDTCHGGESLGGSTSAELTPGRVLQAPSLRHVSMRGPWLHDGCATSLEAVFGACAAGAHAVPPEALEPLLAFLRTL